MNIQPANMSSPEKQQCAGDSTNKLTEVCLKKKSEEGVLEENARVNMPDLISRLNLNSFYPHKFTTADALNISNIEDSQSEQPLKDGDLAFVFLHKLLTMNYRARSMISNTEIEDRVDEEETFDAFLDEENSNISYEDENAQIHPMDVQMAVFHSADSFLKQNMVTKISSCQYALPLLVPSPLSSEIELPLWTFRQIKKTWKSSESSSTTQPACQAKVPMVFFCRLGSVSTSKSNLLNVLINQNHDTFFHRDSPGSSKNRLFIEGLAEISWYCPAGNTDDLFSECIAFCNLHGDAIDNIKQADFLNERSTVTVVLMQNKKLDEKMKEWLLKLHTQTKPLICVVNELQKGVKNTKGNNVTIGLKDTQKAELQKQMVHAIKMCLKKCSSDDFFSLQESSYVAKHNGFRIDEDSEDCQAGKRGATEIMKLLTNEDVSKIKATYFPCQGNMWHEWSRKNKQLGRIYRDDEQTKSKIQQEMQSIRDQQKKHSLNNLIGAVHKNLNSTNTAEKMYFVKWLGIYLDVSFSGKLSEVTQQYYKQLTDVDLLKQRGENTEEKDKELKRLFENVDALTLGLEHIVREMGQIFEAWSEGPENMKADVSAFPGLAADQLISGHPLELMDGDAAHVPLAWIESVLDKVIERLGDKRVFVVSVLGRQSSGKSTMLNTIFGLQFAVSAGKCTRGAFMQLVRVQKEVKEELKFDYLLVVDTEGLQSLESVRADLTHDNELATFVTGLADLTLINIFGENPAEMQDIIQIVVQSFLRMKKVNLNPSCMFVHQNVTDITAAEKNMEGKRRLQETLDNMTQLAATEEDCSAQYFTDVIKFNIQTDVHYFAQLWEGNPPMAPPNPRYSENAKRLKQAILRSAEQNKSQKLSEFKVRIKDLWTAVLNEDFVFSFKNTLEISAYRKLEVKYWNWTWELRRCMLLIQNRMHNMIDNETLVSIDQNWIIAEISDTFCTVKKEMEKFFTEDKDAGILYQWKTRTEQRIENIHEQLIETTAKKMTDLIKLKVACKNLDERKTQYENELFNRSKDLASELKDKARNEQELEKNFGVMWEKWVSDLTAEIPRQKDVSIEQDVMNIINSSYEARTVHSSKQSCCYMKICEKGEYSEYVTMKKKFLGISQDALKCEDNNSIRKLVQQTVSDAEEIIKSKPVAKQGYSDTYIQEILNCVKKRVTDFKTNNFTLKKDFSVDLSLYICDTAVRKFTELHRVFREANDPLIYLEKKKNEFFSIFKKHCEGASATTVFADFVCSKLKPSILQAVYDQAARDATNEMKTNFPAFNGNRSNLEKHILLDLAKKEDFEQFITYIMNPKKHFSEFINKSFKEQMLENTKILHFLKNAVKKKQSKVSSAIQKATEETKLEKGNVKKWLERFALELTDEMKCAMADLIGTKESQEIMDIDFFENALNKALQTVIEGMMTNFEHISSVRAEMFRQGPEEVLVEQLCGCWVQCPFCAAICTNTMERHVGDHSVPFHRPDGVNGFTWYNTNNLGVDFCTKLVKSTYDIVLPDESCVPYKTYREAGPKYACWNITFDASEQPYWKWFVCRFQKDLETHFKKTFQGQGEIPSDWKDISKEKAINSLAVIFGL